MRNPVTQTHPYGCGLACVAFVLRKPYRQLSAGKLAAQASTQGFYCRQLREILEAYSWKGEWKYLKHRWKRKIYTENTIVFIKRSSLYPAGHYLVRHNGYWMDPWINFQIEKDIRKSKSGYRKRLPGQPIYALFIEPVI